MSSYTQHRENLLILSHYIREVRGKGKTKLLKTGVDSYDKKFHLVTVNHEQAKLITKNKNCNMVTLGNLGNLIGSDKPIIIDQEAFAVLADNSITEMNRISKTLDTVLEIAEKYQGIYHEYNLKTLEYFATPWYKFSKKRKLRKELIDFDKEMEIGNLYDKFTEILK